jgi:glycerophosphoryl diester phosphodiesterase
MAVIVLMTVLTAPTPAMADTLVLREEFGQVAEGALPAGWSADAAAWGVRDGRLQGAALEGETTILLGEKAWRDVSLAADVRFEEAGNPSRWLGLVLREAGKDHPGIQFTVRRDPFRNNGLELAARRSPSDGDGWHVFQTAAARPGSDGRITHHVCIEARGDWIRTYLDGERVFQCPRGSEIAHAGQVGFRINGAVVTIDRVEVRQLDPMRPAELRQLRAHPLVIAHRGLSYRAPENTLASYREAIEAGADMAECDVWLSADRVPVLLHDANLKRTTGLDAEVTSLPLAELKELDAGRWKSPEFAGERIPTLKETLLELVKGRIRLVIEIKMPGMEREVLEDIREVGLTPADVMIFSFNHDVVDTITKLEPRLPTTWLIGEMPWQDAERREVLTRALSARASAIGLPLVRVDPAIVRLAHESGFQVFVWTVNEPADMRYLERIGVDGIISDRPDLVLEVLESRGGRQDAPTATP